MMAGYIKANDLAPDLVLCSAAARTRETLERMTPVFEPAPRIDYREAFYGAGVRVWMTAFREVEDADCVLAVGHNPTMEALAKHLIDTSRSDAEAANWLSEKFPTAALAIFELAIRSWRDLTRGTGALKAFVTPKSLGSIH